MNITKTNTKGNRIQKKGRKLRYWRLRSRQPFKEWKERIGNDC